MKRTTCLSAGMRLALVSALAGLTASAVTLPVWEDTSSTRYGTITVASGKASTLPVNANAQAFLKFNFANLPETVTPTNITGARLTFYLSKVTSAADLSVRIVTSDWTEGVAATRPGLGETIATIPAAQVASREFIVVDVTPLVRAWKDGMPNYGVVITADTGSMAIGSKEGNTLGLPASLEIDAAVASSVTVVNGSTIQAGTIGSAQIADGCVGAAELAPNIGVWSRSGSTVGYSSGNVGIGTANPIATLDVRGTALFSQLIVSNSAAVSTNPFSGVGLQYYMNSGEGALMSSYSNGVAGMGYLSFYTKALGEPLSKKMVISYAGDVGIGTSTPQAKLDVNGNAIVRGNLTVQSNINASSITGTNITAQSNVTVQGLLKMGSPTNAADVPNPAGLVIRRINSTVITSGTTVARTDTVRLERDGTYGGWKISYSANPGYIAVAFMGMDSSGNTRNFYTKLSNPAAAGTIQVFTDAQSVVHFQGSFGYTVQAGYHLTTVNLTRATSDNYWMGNLTSSYNQ